MVLDFHLYFDFDFFYLGGGAKLPKVGGGMGQNRPSSKKDYLQINRIVEEKKMLPAGKGWHIVFGTFLRK